VHPAILVPGVVMVGQFGPFWLLLSAPIVAIAVDLVRYVHGRLSEPPRPAGVLPGEPVPAGGTTGATATSTAGLPSAYRPGRAPRPIVAVAAVAAPAVAVPVAVSRRVLNDGR
jgi:hypothetical protein